MSDLALPARLDLLAAAPLAETIPEAGTSPLTLDASAVSHLGTPGLQVLLAARRSYSEAGVALHVADASDAMVEQLRLFGLTPQDLSTDPEEE